MTTKATNNEKIAVGNRVTISPRGKKRIWTADFWHDGQHRRVSLKTRDKKVAIDRATKLGNDLLEGTHRVVRHETAIEKGLADYLTFLETEDRAAKTLVRYRGELERFRDFCAEHRVRQLGRITPSLFDRYRAFRKPSVSAKTLYHEGVVIKQWLKWCVSRHLLAANPLADVKVPEPPLVVRPAPTLAQVQAVLRSCSEPKRTMFAVLAFAGMRSGELRQLRREDVDLAGGWFRVVSRAGARTKTGESRGVPMHPVLRELLAGMPASKGPWFFCAEPSGRYPDGGHWVNTKKLNEYFLARLEALGLPAGREGLGFTVHSLRHFFETHCVNALVPQRVVDKWLGHKPDGSMAAVYYHLDDETSQRFMDGLDFAL